MEKDRKPWEDLGVIMTNDVQVEVLPWLSRALGKESKVILTESIREGENLKSLFERIASKHDAFGALIYNINCGTVYDGVEIFVNNKSIKNVNMKIKSGYKITVTPLYYGG